MFMTDADLLAGRVGFGARELGSAAAADTTRAFLRRRYPLLTRFIVRVARSQRLDRMSGRGWVAVGDAAIVFDPLSSQGIAKGVEHGVQAADAVLAYLDGDDAALERLSDRFAMEFTGYERNVSGTTPSRAGGRTHRSGVAGNLAEDELTRHPPEWAAAATERPLLRGHA